MFHEIGWRTVLGNLHVNLGRQKCWIGTSPNWVIVGKNTARLLGALNLLSTKYQDAEYAEMAGKVNKIMIRRRTTTTTTIINISININIIINVLNHPIIVPLIIPSILPSPPPNTRSRRPLVLLVQIDSTTR